MGTNLKELMYQRRYTVSELSKLTGISRTTITTLRAGRADGIQFKTLKALCRFLNCTPNDILWEGRNGN